MSGARSASTNQSPQQTFINALSDADGLVNQRGVRLPYIFGAYKNALELYQQISVEDQSEVILAYYFECRGKFLRHSSALIDDLIKPALVDDVVKDKLIKHAETVLEVRERFLTVSDTSEMTKQSNFTERILLLKQDLEIVKVAGSWGYNCINIPKDGNCLFNAIADQLKLNGLTIANPLHDEPHHALRSLAVKHIEVNKECYAVHIPNDTTLSTYTDGLARSGTWGDHLEIMALVRELRITLVLIQDDQNILVFKTQHSIAIFYLGYETNYHFVSLHKQDNSPLRRELEAKIENAPVVEIGHYILDTVLEKKKKVSTVSNSESKKTVPTGAAKKFVLLLAGFFKPSNTASAAKDKGKQQKPNELRTLITKGSSCSL